MTFLQAPPDLGPLPKRIFQDFNVANGPLPSGWWSRYVAGDTNAVPEVFSGYLRAGTTAASNVNSRFIARFNEPLTSDNQIVRGTTTTAINGLLGGPSLKMNDGVNGGVMAILSTGSDRGLWSINDSGGTKVASFTLPTTAIGDVWALKAEGNVYTLLRNPNDDNTGGTVIVTWTDTTGLINTGPDWRLGGYFVNSDRNFFGTRSWSAGWDNFDYRDLAWTA